VTGRFNLSDAQWAVLEPLLPKPKKPGRPPKWTKRRLAHRGGCAGHAAGGSDHRRSVQDRDAARPLLWNLHRAYRRIRLIWADAVYTASWPAAHLANENVSGDSVLSPYSWT
jgi:transposase